MTKTQTPTEYVAEHFADAPTEWIVGEIARIATALSEHGQHVEWRRGLIDAYVTVLAERGTDADREAEEALR